MWCRRRGGQRREQNKVDKKILKEMERDNMGVATNQKSMVIYHAYEMHLDNYKSIKKEVKTNTKNSLTNNNVLYL